MAFKPAQEVVSPRLPGAGASLGPTITARILVVEDDLPLSENLCEILQLFGHTPMAVPTAEAALDTVATAGIDLIVTDLRLPSMSGVDLLDRLRSRDRPIPAVLMSDWTSDDALNDRLSTVDFLAKPFDIAALLSSIARLLAPTNTSPPVMSSTDGASCAD